MFIFAFVTFMFMAQVGTVDHDQPLQIHSVNMRPARKNDIGLYFDIVVINSIISGGYEETLPIAVHSDKCCVKDPKSREMNCDHIQIVGGDFGQLEPGKSVIFSTILPTLSLYNRVGHCNIYVRSQRSNGVKVSILHTVKFNTSVPCRDCKADWFGGMKLQHCSEEDLDPLNECRPVICEDKYFGRKNHFNDESNECEKVPMCGGNTVYNFNLNKCINLNTILTASDLEILKDSSFD